MVIGPLGFIYSLLGYHLIALYTERRVGTKAREKQRTQNVAKATTLDRWVFRQVLVPGFWFLVSGFSKKSAKVQN